MMCARQSFWWVIPLMTACLASDCVETNLYPMGPPMTLPNDPPRNACESKQWLRIVPALTRTVGAYYRRGSGRVTRMAEGYAVFRGAENEPEVVDDLWAVMQEPELQRAHESRTRTGDPEHPASSFPTDEDAVRAAARQRLFVRDEDDLTALSRGIARANADIREACAAGIPAQDR